MRSALRPFKVEPGTINDVPADEIRFYRIGRAFLGDHDLGATTCVVGPAARYMGNGIMGYDFFRDNVVLADFVKQVIWIKKKRG